MVQIFSENSIQYGAGPCIKPPPARLAFLSDWISWIYFILLKCSEFEEKYFTVMDE